MKTKNIDKKLSLSKATVATLNDRHMNILVGGVIITRKGAFTCETQYLTCTLDLSACYNRTCGTECQ